MESIIGTIRILGISKSVIEMVFPKSIQDALKQEPYNIVTLPKYIFINKQKRSAIVNVLSGNTKIFEKGIKIDLMGTKCKALLARRNLKKINKKFGLPYKGLPQSEKKSEDSKKGFVEYDKDVSLDEAEKKRDRRSRRENKSRERKRDSRNRQKLREMKLRQREREKRKKRDKNNEKKLLKDEENELFLFLKDIHLEQYYEKFVKKKYYFEDVPNFTIKTLRGIISDEIHRKRFLDSAKKLSDSKIDVENMTFKKDVNESKKKDVLKFAFVCGMSKYDNFPNLKNCKNDSLAVAKLLKDFGFEVTCCNDVDAEDFLDEFDSFVICTKSIIEKANVNAFIFVFFAGHGLFTLDDDLLLPVDFKLKYLDISINQSLFEKMDSKGKEKHILEKKSNARHKLMMKCLSPSKIKHDLSTIRSAKFCLFVDCCRNRYEMKYRFSISASERNIGAKYLISYSTSKDNVAKDSSINGEHSPYTYSWLKRMKSEKGDIAKILIKVSDDVKRETNSNQTPVISDVTTSIEWPC